MNLENITREDVAAMVARLQEVEQENVQLREHVSRAATPATVTHGTQGATDAAMADPQEQVEQMQQVQNVPVPIAWTPHTEVVGNYTRLVNKPPVYNGERKARIINAFVDQMKDYILVGNVPIHLQATVAVSYLG